MCHVKIRGREGLIRPWVYLNYSYSYRNWHSKTYLEKENNLAWIKFRQHECMTQQVWESRCRPHLGFYTVDKVMALINIRHLFLSNISSRRNNRSQMKKIKMSKMETYTPPGQDFKRVIKIGSILRLNWETFQRVRPAWIWSVNIWIWGMKQKGIGKATIFLAWMTVWLLKLLIKTGNIEVAGEEWWRIMKLALKILILNCQ